MSLMKRSFAEFIGLALPSGRIFCRNWTRIGRNRLAFV